MLEHKLDVTCPQCGLEGELKIEADLGEGVEECIRSLVEIQRFPEQTRKHRAWAWDALNALSPEIAKLAAEDPQKAFDEVME